jgi:hypothetical protein
VRPAIGTTAKVYDSYGVDELIFLNTDPAMAAARQRCRSSKGLLKVFRPFTGRRRPFARRRQRAAQGGADKVAETPRRQAGS